VGKPARKTASRFGFARAHMVVITRKTSSGERLGKIEARGNIELSSKSVLTERQLKGGANH